MRLEAEKTRVLAVERLGRTQGVIFGGHWSISMPEGVEVCVGEEITFLWPFRDNEVRNEASLWGKRALAVVVRGEVYTYPAQPQTERE